MVHTNECDVIVWLRILPSNSHIFAAYLLRAQVAIKRPAQFRYPVLAVEDVAPDQEAGAEEVGERDEDGSRR